MATVKKLSKKDQAILDAEGGLDAVVAQLIAHASKNYDKNGWDILIECWEPSEIKARLEGRCVNLRGAICVIAGELKDAGSYRDEICAEADRESGRSEVVSAWLEDLKAG